eukprot:2273917-Prorocentrum_lima.AAC.1
MHRCRHCTTSAATRGRQWCILGHTARGAQDVREALALSASIGLRGAQCIGLDCCLVLSRNVDGSN